MDFLLSRKTITESHVLSTMGALPHTRSQALTLNANDRHHEGINAVFDALHLVHSRHRFFAVFSQSLDPSLPFGVCMLLNQQQSASEMTCLGRRIEALDKIMVNNGLVLYPISVPDRLYRKTCCLRNPFTVDSSIRLYHKMLNDVIYQ